MSPAHPVHRLHQLQHHIVAPVGPRLLPARQHRLDATDHTVVARHLGGHPDLLQPGDEHMIVEDRRETHAGADHIEAGAVEALGRAVMETR